MASINKNTFFCLYFDQFFHLCTFIVYTGCMPIRFKHNRNCIVLCICLCTCTYQKFIIFCSNNFSFKKSYFLLCRYLDLLLWKYKYINSHSHTYMRRHRMYNYIIDMFLVIVLCILHT